MPKFEQCDYNFFSRSNGWVAVEKSLILEKKSVQFWHLNLELCTEKWIGEWQLDSVVSGTK